MMAIRFALLATALFVLTACPLDDMKKVTEETRDEVKETKLGAQIAAALEVCLDHGISASARVAACKPVLLKLPTDRLVDYLGIPLRILDQDSAKLKIETAEVDLPNVLYVGEAKEMDWLLSLAPTSEDLYNVLRMAAIQAINDIGSKSMLPGVSAEDMETYRGYGRRLIFVGTALFGAVRIKDVSKNLSALATDLSDGKIGVMSFQVNSNRIASTLPKIVSEKQRTLAAHAMVQLAKSLSLSEQELLQLGNLNKMRLNVAH